jgi:hypothetical protein
MVIRGLSLIVFGRTGRLQRERMLVTGNLDGKIGGKASG